MDRLGAELEARDTIDAVGDIYFLTRDEIVAALDGQPAELAAAVAERRRAREDRRLLDAPLSLGKPAGPWKRVEAILDAFGGCDDRGGALVSGVGTSAGRATGPVRIVRGLDDFDRLEPGDVLVAPITAPAWTPLFAFAAAVVTDGGSPFAHASVIAREFGIPAVVGTANATSVLRDGDLVVVDGAAGIVTMMPREV
jgi:pyruvate,water dikinase